MQFKEIPENPEELGPRAEQAIITSHVIGPAVEFIGKNLHGSGMLKTGEKWTVTLAISCGFHAEVEMRVFHTGKCEGHSHEGNVESESSVRFAERADGVKLPFPSESIMREHQLSRPPGKH